MKHEIHLIVTLSNFCRQALGFNQFTKRYSRLHLLFEQKNQFFAFEKTIVKFTVVPNLFDKFSV